MKQGTLFITSPGKLCRKGPLYQEIIRQHPGNDFSSILYLTPNNFVSGEVKRGFFNFFIKSSDKKACIPFSILTLRQATLHYYSVFEDRKPVSDNLRVLIMGSIARGQNIGHARLLSDLLNKIRHHTPDRNISDIQHEVSQLIFEDKARANALNALQNIESYNDELADKHIADLLDVLIESIGFIQSSNLFDYKTLVIDGFYDPTPLELNIIKAFMQKTDRAFMFVEQNTEIYDFAKSVEQFEIRKTKGPVEKQSTKYHSYPSIEEEVEGIVKEIKKLIIDGISPEDITVTFPVLAKYTRMVKRISNKHGVPVNLGIHGITLSGYIVVIDDLLTCVRDDYPLNAFLSFLSSPFLKGIPEVVSKHAVTFSYRAGIVTGKEPWLTVEPVLLRSTEHDISDEFKEKIRQFQKRVVEIIDSIEQIRISKDLGTFSELMILLLNKYGYFDASEIPGQSDSNYIIDRIYSIFDELKHFTSIYPCAEDFNIDRAIQFVRFLFQNISVHDENTHGVRVLPYELAVSCESKALFFGGLIEEDFPSRPAIDPLLPEKVKKTLGIPYLEYYLKRQKLYFRRLMNHPEKEVYCSLPSAEGDKVLLPSPFLDWEEEITPRKLNLFSEEDILIREGEIRHKDVSIFGNGNIIPDTDSLKVYLKRMGDIAKGYFSVTDLDFFRRCPLRFYIERVLDLEMERTPRFEIEARLWGSLAHRTMEKLFKEKPDVEKIEKRLFSALEESLREFPIGDFWGKVAREIFRNLLPMIITEETGIKKKGFIPYLVEKKIKAEIDGVRLKGKIDRIDKKLSADSSQLSGEKELRTTEGRQRDTVILLDYKTGMLDSRSLQLPLYAVVWERNFPEHVEKTGYYSLKEGQVKWLPARKDIQTFMHEALENAKVIVRNLQKGLIVPEPSDTGQCRYCYHGSLCNGSR